MDKLTYETCIELNNSKGIFLNNKRYCIIKTEDRVLKFKKDKENCIIFASLLKEKELEIEFHLDFFKVNNNTYCNFLINNKEKNIGVIIFSCQVIKQANK